MLTSTSAHVQNLRDTTLAAELRQCSISLPSLIDDETARAALDLVAQRARDEHDRVDLVNVLGLSYVVPMSQVSA